MAGEFVIGGVVANAPSFINSLCRVKSPQLQGVIKDSLRKLLLTPVGDLPGKLNFHQLTGKTVPSAVAPDKKVAAWSLHVVPNGDYKASFTFEGGVIYLRQVDTHAVIDKRP